MSDGTWDDYLEAGGTDATELDGLADTMDATAGALGDVGTDAADAAADALGGAQWETETAAEWTRSAESDVGYADQLDTEAAQHLDAAVDAAAQGDVASAQWEATMAEGSLELSDDAMDSASGALGLSDDHLDAADLGVDVAADALDTSDDWSVDTGVDAGGFDAGAMDTSTDWSVDTGLDTGLDAGGFDAGGFDTGMDSGIDDI